VRPARQDEAVHGPDGLPDPALVVLVGPAGSGKSHWAAQRYRPVEVVSSDALRAVVGSGTADLDATDDAFAVLDHVVRARLSRGLTTVVDTLGLDDTRRRGYLELARNHALPAVAVVVATPEALCRRRNGDRDRPVPAPALARQVRRAREVADGIDAEGWDVVHLVDGSSATTDPATAAPTDEPGGDDLDVVLQVSRFPWGEDPSGWLGSVADAAEQAGFGGIAVMDHLLQIPQVGRAWDPLPEAWTTLGFLAARTSRVRLGTLVSPASLRAPGLVAKAVATLDVLSGGRAFCGLGAGWFEREHAGFGLPFPAPGARVDALAAAVETVRALWAPGTKAFAGRYASLPETACYPRPLHDVEVVVGGSGPRVLRVAAELADAVNVRTQVLEQVLPRWRVACTRAGREPRLTVLDTPVVGTDRDDVARRVEKQRGRTPSAAFAARQHVGTAARHRDRYLRLQDEGVSTVFVAVADLDGADDLERLAGLVPPG
jgi:alkanesulfonate monooxygenase SsuD/methylene tetrahydromethanopterin reductase-like flavin-dependent oxidoreductase (luciferase family)/predicted kinase